MLAVARRVGRLGQGKVVPHEFDDEIGIVLQPGARDRVTGAELARRISAQDIKLVGLAHATF